MANGLDVPEIPTKGSEYRSKIWIEIHLLRKDVEDLKQFKKKVYLLEGEVKRAKIWAQASSFFVGLLVTTLTTLKVIGLI